MATSFHELGEREIFALAIGQERNEIASMEQESRRYYEIAAQKSTTAPIRQLLNDLAKSREGKAWTLRVPRTALLRKLLSLCEPSRL